MTKSELDYVYKCIHLSENHLFSILGESFADESGKINEKLERAVREAWGACANAREEYHNWESVKSGTNRDIGLSVQQPIRRQGLPG